jgi:aromatic-L-amino-acid/L-tryptophan decarboxylase
METTRPATEESLDPQDWEALRRLGRRMVDDLMDHLAGVRERPVWRPVPQAVKDRLAQPLPIEAEGAGRAYEDFRELVLPYPLGNTHPRFWGWVIGTGTPLGMLAEMLAAGMNSSASFGEQSPVYVERQVLDWLKEMLCYPAEASGLLVSGGSMANFVGLAVARNARAGFDVASAGLQSSHPKLVLYGSVETHNSVQKAVELLGLGSDSFRRVPVDAEYRVDPAALRAAIADDRAAGRQPFCVVGNAGTVNTGAFDDLGRLADICEAEKLWLHVDGAFGALAALAPELRHLTAGMERADSLAFDLHKWMYMPYEAGCVLVRSGDEHRRTFSVAASYLSDLRGGVAGGPIKFSEYGVELSRGFRALKVWMSLKEHGVEKYARLIRQNVGQARHLAELIAAAPELELLAPAPLNVVCFRFVDARLSEPQLNELNRELLVRLHESGVAAPSFTTLGGRFAVRAAITNHRSRREDFDLLVSKVVELGHSLVRGLSSQAA